MQINRNCFSNLVDQIFRPEISLLIGPRQVGKTWLLNKVNEHCVNLGKKTKYFNLENPNDLHSFKLPYKDLYNFLTLNEGTVIFIDEFHYLENASKLFKAIFDSKKNIKIFASGSSSIELHKHLKESLSGRLIKNRIYPLAYSEYKQIPNTNLNSYLMFGGLPGIINSKSDEEKLLTIQNIVETYLIKDIKSLIKEENIRSFNNLLFILADQQANVLPTSNLSRELGLSEPTVSKYLEILKQTYVLGSVDSFSRRLGNELKKSKKYFIYDQGVSNMLLKNFSSYKNRSDKGIIGETFVYNNLIRQLKPNMDLKFWRTKQGAEVDFVVLKNNIPYPIEVKTSINKYEVPSSLKKFLINYPECKTAFILAENCQEHVIKIDNTEIFVKHWEDAENLDFMQNID